MHIKKLYWISAEALEAEVTISDGNYKINSFCQPCEYRVGEAIEDCLYGYDVKNIMQSDNLDYVIEKGSDIWDYSLNGKVVDKNKNIVLIGEIKIEIENLPKDIEEGEFIKFSCSRIDLY